MDVLCLDPGETTGWAVLRTVPLIDRDGECSGRFALMVHASGQSETWHGWDEWVCKVHAVVAERFALYATHATKLIGNEFPASQVIGVAKHKAEECGVELVIQPASTIHWKAKQINPALKPTVDALLFGKSEHDNRHQRDAVAHGVHWLLHTAKGRKRAERDARNATNGRTRTGVQPRDAQTETEA